MLNQRLDLSLSEYFIYNKNVFPLSTSFNSHSGSLNATSENQFHDFLMNGIVHSLSFGKVEMFLCATCHAFTPHVNAWKR